MWKILIYLLCMLMMGSAAADVPFAPGEAHKSHLDYRQYFETMSTRTMHCTVSFDVSAYDSETAAKVLAQVAADEEVLSSFAAMEPCTIYVVKKPLAGLQRIGTAIYCTAAQVLEGSYRPWLAEAAFQLERWQAVGLTGLLFGENVDEAALADWYATDVHDDMLSLFPAYFVEDFAGEDERRMASSTAISLMQYMLTRLPTEKSLTADPAAYAADWLATIGVNRAYADPYAGLLDGYTYTHNQFYPLIGKSPKGDVFKLAPLEYDMTTPCRVRMALCELEKGVDAILDGVKRDVPEWYDRLAANYAAPITYEFNGECFDSVTHLAARRVEVGAAFSLIHETVHMMTPCVFTRISRYTDYWKTEAIAEYLALTYYPGLIRQADDWRYFQEEVILALDDEMERAFYERLRDDYLLHAFWPDKPQDVNEKLYWRLAALTKKELRINAYSVSDTYSSVGSATMEESNGNELSYTEAEWLASYLIKQHGLSAFLHYCLDEDVTFEAAFGLPYEEAKADWLVNRNVLD